MNAAPPFTIFPLGDSALVISFGNVIDENTNKKVLALFHSIKGLAINGVQDVIPAYSSLAVQYDVITVRQKSTDNKNAFKIMRKIITKIIEENHLSERYDMLPSRKIKVPVCYAVKYAPDMHQISLEKKLTAAEIIQLHTGKKYRVYMIGFLPGFAYMGEVDDKIAIPRKQQPRLNVASGSVGIAGKQTGIYPLPCPGGWQIIGKTPLKLFDRRSDDPILFQPGDEVEFYSISEDEFTNY